MNDITLPEKKHLDFLHSELSSRSQRVASGSRANSRIVWIRVKCFGGRLRHSGAARRCQERGKRDAQHGDDGGRVCGRRRRHRSIRSSCPALQVHPTQLRNWVKAFADDPAGFQPYRDRCLFPGRCCRKMPWRSWFCYRARFGLFLAGRRSLIGKHHGQRATSYAIAAQALLVGGPTRHSAIVLRFCTMAAR